MIEEGELCLVGELNERYDDWYDNDEEMFLFEDPQNVLGIIKKTCHLIHHCVDTELYGECYELVDVSMGISVWVGGDYSEYEGDPLSLKEIHDSELGPFDYHQLVMDVLCIAYWANSIEERPDALYWIINQSQLQDIKLEAFIQSSSRELENLSDFLERWINYLGRCQPDQITVPLLLEAVDLQNDNERTLEQARKFSAKHPELYEHLLKQTDGEDQKLFSIGQEALQKIQPQFKIRGRIALLTAEYALRLNKQKEAERCWLEAFRSNTTPVNYLHLLVEKTNASDCQEEAKRIYHSVDQIVQIMPYYSQSAVLMENKISKPTYYALAFLGGEFAHVFDKGMNRKAPLGWSTTFMKEGIAWFLLALYEGEELAEGCYAMYERICDSISFSADNFSKGLLKPISGEDTSLYQELFLKWKSLTPIDPSEQQLFIKRLEKLVNIRTVGILNEQRRNYYGECAAFIAALGEVKESRGEVNGKENLLLSYQKMYPHHSAFRRELKAFGLKK